MIKKILLFLAAIIIIFLVVVVLQPADFRIARSATIAAPSAVIFEQTNDLGKWQESAPWARLDPAAKVSFEGPPSGRGASVAWTGNSKIGAGRLTITESRPDELVSFSLELLKPIAMAATTEFAFRPEGDQTVVTWSVSGRRTFMLKAAGLFVNMDKIVGGQLDKGLARLKSMAEAAQP